MSWHGPAPAVVAEMTPQRPDGTPPWSIPPNGGAMLRVTRRILALLDAGRTPEQISWILTGRPEPRAASDWFERRPKPADSF